jgi:hypothetical protein
VGRAKAKRLHRRVNIRDFALLLSEEEKKAKV